MKLWILRPREDLVASGRKDPWDPWYDKSHGFVVRAETEQEARELAKLEGGDENRDYGSEPMSPWMAAHYSTCLPLTHYGEVGIVMRDFLHA